MKFSRKIIKTTKQVCSCFSDYFFMFYRNNGNAPTNHFPKPKRLPQTDPTPKNTIALTINHTIVEDNGVSKNNLSGQNSKQVAQVHVQEQDALLAPNHNKETNNV